MIGRLRVLMVVSLFAAAALAQAPAQPAGAPQAGTAQAGGARPGPGGPPQELKNIKVLTGMTHDEVVQSMRAFSAALGVQCGFCHVDNNGRLQPDLDDKKEKQTARKMITMMKAINDQNFDGHMEVTCATCHQGRNHPRAFSPIADLETIKARLAAPHDHDAEARASYPKPADLFAKYEAAIGGDAAIDKLTTRIDKYTTSDAAGHTTSGENIRKAPDKVAATTSFGPGRQQTMGFDGTAAWQAGGRGVQPITGPNLEQMKFVANFNRDLKPSDRYSRAVVVGKETINGHEAWAVRGAVKGTRINETLWFDAESGLLLRRLTLTPTPMGPTADQIDFEDYRVVDGIKVPFVLKTATADTVGTRTYTEVKFNAPVEDAKFAMPAKEEGKTAQ